REVKIGFVYFPRFVWLPILGAVVTAVLGGPWWVPLSCFAVMVMGYAWSTLATGVLVYFSWGTWWMAVPLVFFVGSTIQRMLETPWRLRQRGMRSLERYIRTNRQRDLRRAVMTLQRALTVARPGDPNRAMYACNYASSLVAFHECRGKADLIELAERLCREALAAVPSDHPHRVVCLNSLSGVLRSRQKRENDPALVAEIVQLARDAVSAPHDDDENLALMTNLGQALAMSYSQDQDPATLAEAVRVCRAAVAAAPPGFEYASGLLNNLHVVLLYSYSVTGEKAALEEAVQLGRHMVAAAPPGSWLTDSLLADLAGALLALFERTRRAELLDEAAKLARGAIAACPPDHPERAMFLRTHGHVLWTAAEYGNRPHLADEAVAALREAIEALPEDHPMRVGYMNDFCAALVTSYTVHKRPDDVTEAVRVGRQAVAPAPHDEPDRALGLLRFGLALEAQYDHVADAAVLTESCHVCAEAAHSTSAPIHIRAMAAQKAAQLYIRAQDYRAALEMAELAVSQIPRTAPRQLGIDDRVHRAVNLAGLAGTAAEAAIGAGEPGRAVELLEQARGVVLGGLFDTRGDVTELHSRAPDLARELDDLVRALDRADQAPDALNRFAGTNHETVSELRARSGRQWDELLARIRERPGLRDFLAPPPIGRLREQAIEGPVIYVVAHREHGSALIVTDDPTEPVVVVDLPLLTQQAVDDQVAALRDACHEATEAEAVSRRRQAQRDTLNVFEWLWDAVAAPVLDAVHLAASPTDGRSWPRIWWCPVGSCAFLPLHAAGRHADGGCDTVMDRVVSSYTTTVRALAHARDSRSGRRGARSTLVVSVPDAPETTPLPGATAEADLLGRLLPAATILHSPDRAAVTAALPHHEIAHFACHSVADTATPADNRLLLRDHLYQPLTVTAISRLRLDRGELAYLSACSTTATPMRHADEAVHVTAALQLAGYRSVVGTLWPINDRAAVTVAEEFYTELARLSGTTLNPATAAIALHHAVRVHRARYPALPTRWAAHIHHGV
ncbi:MAG TPA: CHAT domain-containing protein, partial [Pseudonocardiaceae bacterium]|nr:CHAT domain-containing protein [Pseudonocardiaceae bacterium]